MTLLKHFPSNQKYPSRSLSKLRERTVENCSSDNCPGRRFSRLTLLGNSLETCINKHGLKNHYSSENCPGRKFSRLTLLGNSLETCINKYGSKNYCSSENCPGGKFSRLTLLGNSLETCKNKYGLKNSRIPDQSVVRGFAVDGQPMIERIQREVSRWKRPPRTPNSVRKSP